MIIFCLACGIMFAGCIWDAIEDSKLPSAGDIFLLLLFILPVAALITFICSLAFSFLFVGLCDEDSHTYDVNIYPKSEITNTYVDYCQFADGNFYEYNRKINGRFKIESVAADKTTVVYDDEAVPHLKVTVTDYEPALRKIQSPNFYFWDFIVTSGYPLLEECIIVIPSGTMSSAGA